MVAPDPPPWVVLEHLQVAGHDLVRVVGVSSDEGSAHDLAKAMANAGLRVWLIDLYNEEGKPTIERHVGAAGAAWLNDRGGPMTPTSAGDELTQAGL